MPARAGAFEGQHWSLAIFSSREAPARLLDAVTAAVEADRGGAALTVDVLVNGNAPLAAEVHARLGSGPWWSSTARVRLWHMPEADKAHAWNEAVHRVMEASDLAFFLDGYVRVDRDALARMADTLRRRSSALAVTSVPSSGRSSAALRRLFIEEGGLHGNFFALRGTTMRRLRRTGFRLPRGIYRNDSALGAALAFDLEPAENVWSWDRIAVALDARYDAPVANPARVADVVAVLKRHLRQAAGELETRALRGHLARAGRSPLHWAPTARGLVLQWAREHRAEARALLWTDPLAWLALRRLRRAPEDAPAGRFERVGDYARATRSAAHAREAPEASAAGKISER